MFLLEDYKKALGDLARGLGDNEVSKIRDLLFELAEIAYETNPKRCHLSKIPPRMLE